MPTGAGEDHARIPPLGTNGQEGPAPLAARLSRRRCLIVFCGFFFDGSFGFSTPLGITTSSKLVRYSVSSHTLRPPRALVIRAAADPPTRTYRASAASTPGRKDRTSRGLRGALWRT
jgi:hypothetical protein